MSSSFTASALRLALASALIPPMLVFAQEGASQTRPRRVSPPMPSETEARDFDAEIIAPPVRPLSSEPIIRVGLATDARAVVISTTGPLLSVVDEAAPSHVLTAERGVRVEPRVLPKLAPPPPRTRTAGSTEDPPPRVRLASSSGLSSPARVAVVYAEGGGAPGAGATVSSSSAVPLMHARAPVTFAPAGGHDHDLLRYNEKPYRGRLEVFVNERGTLTVVNVVGLENYVRGVVPNELSPGGYPELESLKAQAVAARTYAVSNRGRFAAEGFDLLPSARSQVYGGQRTEHPLADRAVAETRGLVATFQGRPINALYTSTCGGRTEHAENIFGGAAVPYLRGRECAGEGENQFAPFVIRTSRDPLILRREEHAESTRDAALLAIYGFRLPSRITDDWLSAPISIDELRPLLGRVALVARQAAPPSITGEMTRPPGFGSALLRALDGESRGDVLLNTADIDYLLAFRDAADIPPENRADVALLLRDNHLTLYADATLRPQQPMPRAGVLRLLTRLLKSRGLINLQKAVARPSLDGRLVIRGGKTPAAAATLAVDSDVYLFRAFGKNLFQVREVTIVGGEAIAYHLSPQGEVDYLEVEPAPNGASSERFSPHTNWVVTLSAAEVADRLKPYAVGTGALLDLRVTARGVSRRALAVEIVGTHATKRLTGGKIRRALGLREQLFFLDRRTNDTGTIKSFIFTGRGWGHGVGMCQVGAYGLARAGMTYDKILNSFYTGIDITRLY